ncbi:hypothetical protein [Agaribacterium sp. ZY112]|uniref:hypothetical protein n=1 Tax=Agaribacterium sp. ZY112 TaxID=3233574 RepID=UPI0035254D36
MLSIHLLDHLIHFQPPKSEYPYEIRHAIFPSGQEPIKYYQKGYDLNSHQQDDAVKLIAWSDEQLKEQALADKLAEDDIFLELDNEKPNRLVAEQDNLLLANLVCRFDTDNDGYFSLELFRHHQANITSNQALVQSIAMQDGQPNGHICEQVTQRTINDHLWIRKDSNEGRTISFYTTLTEQYFVALHLTRINEQIDAIMDSVRFSNSSYAGSQQAQLTERTDIDINATYQYQITQLKQARKAAKQARVDAMPEAVREYYQFEVDDE